MQKEIEVKARVEDFSDIKTRLEGFGCSFGEPVVQEDIIFVNFKDDFTAFKPGANFLRIRNAKGKIFFTLKQPQANELDCIEKEVEISDSDQFRGALELMGYHEAVRVRKTRLKAKYNDIEICLDDVADLGTFIELERITDGDGKEVQEELVGFLETLGIGRENRVEKGYDTLVYLSQKGI